jgi:pantoate--beta-alanine ligase
VQQINHINELRALVSEWREAGDAVALVPTMGNLHKGHMSLVELAAQHAEHVVVSVFVNPTQFGLNEDYESYPRTLQNDARKLKRAGVAVLFAPSVDEMYPQGLDDLAQVIVPGMSDELCGKFRPGHFAGVTSVVCRLLNICAPDVAVFGQKDYQQLVILRRMVTSLHMPVSLIAGPTERDEKGLALSSRNSYLSDDQGEVATVIRRSLEAAAARLKAGDQDYVQIEGEAHRAISDAGLSVEYVVVRTTDNLSIPDSDAVQLVVLAAAKLGDVRLIDNIVAEVAG